MASECRVRIVIPTFNRAYPLLEAIASVRRQSFSNWRITVIDDGSTDDTLAILEQLGEPKLDIISARHTGQPGELRNAAVQASDEQYIAFLDSDDLWMPSKLEQQMKALEGDATAGWSFTGFVRQDSVGSKSETDYPPPPWKGQTSFCKSLFLQKICIVTPSVMVERGLFEKVGGFDTSLSHCEDYDLWFRLAVLSRPIVLPALLSHVRKFEDQFGSPQLEVCESWLAAYEKHQKIAASELRRVIRQQRAHFSARLGHLMISEGKAGGGQYLFKSIRTAPLSCRTWRLCLREFINYFVRGPHRR